MASTHEAKLTIKADVADASRKMHDLEMAVQKLEAQIAKKKRTAESAAKATDQWSKGNSRATELTVMAASSAFDLANRLDDMAKKYALNSAIAANYTGDLDKLRKAVNGTADDITLMRLSNQAMQLGVVKTSKDMENFAAAAAKVGAKAGLNAEASIESLTAALGRGSTEMLDNLGIVLKVEQAQAEYAARLGKTKEALTDIEKAEAFRVIGMEKVMDASLRTTEATNKTGDRLAYLSAQFQNGANEVLNLDRHIGDLIIEMSNTNVAAGNQEFIIARLIKSWREMGTEFDRSFGPFVRLNIQLRDQAEALRQQAEAADRAKQAWTGLGNEMMWALSRGTTSMEVDSPFVGMMFGAGFAQLGRMTEGMKFEKAQAEKQKRRGGGRARQSDINELLDTGITGGGADMAGILGYGEDVRIAEQRLQLAQQQEASLERQFQLQQQLRDAEMAALDARLMGTSDPDELAAITEEREALVFQRQIDRNEYQIALAARRAKAEEDAQRRIQQAHARTAKAINDASSLTGSAIQGVADIAMTASEQHGESAEKAERKRRAWGAGILAVDAIFYGAKSAAAFAALNPIEGAGFLSAAIISTAKAIQLGGSVSGVGGGGRGGGGAGGMTERGPIQRERSAGPASKVPGTAGSPSALPAGQRATGSTVVYVNTQVLGSIDETSAVKIQRGLEDAMRSGRIRTGRPS